WKREKKKKVPISLSINPFHQRCSKTPSPSRSTLDLPKSLSFSHPPLTTSRQRASTAYRSVMAPQTRAGKRLKTKETTTEMAPQTGGEGKEKGRKRQITKKTTTAMAPQTRGEGGKGKGKTTKKTTTTFKNTRDSTTDDEEGGLDGNVGCRGRGRGDDRAAPLVSSEGQFIWNPNII
ncbi:hypothetical protein V2J09_000438, partial [Rumex salicifolius]